MWKSYISIGSQVFPLLPIAASAVIYVPRRARIHGYMAGILASYHEAVNLTQAAQFLTSNVHPSSYAASRGSPSAPEPYFTAEQ